MTAAAEMRRQYVGMGASFSLSRRYRYRLWRVWNEGQPKTMVVIGLNPSTADENEDDPTIRRCIGFAKREGCGSLVMVNLFAYRSTDPHELKRLHLVCSDPVGPSNDGAILEACTLPDVVIVAAWGQHGALCGRSAHVLSLLAKRGIRPHCFGLTNGGLPRHPLYLPNTAPLIPVPA